MQSITYTAKLLIQLSGEVLQLSTQIRNLKLKIRTQSASSTSRPNGTNSYVAVGLPDLPALDTVGKATKL